ncbi:MAG: hypothetical protein LBR89_01295 [Holosporales bacterium]|nr:hypothetical protein [Holosporales bacterium]
MTNATLTTLYRGAQAKALHDAELCHADGVTRAYCSTNIAVLSRLASSTSIALTSVASTAWWPLGLIIS